MKTNIIKLMVALAVVSAGCAGCSSGQNQSQNQNASPQQNVNIVPTKWGSPIDQSIANEAKKRVIRRKEVTEVHAANSKKDLMVAVKLKTFQRFNSQQIVKKIAKSLQKDYPKRKVQVSSDKKIFAEVADLENKLKKDEVSPKQLEKKMKRINRFMKDPDPSKQ